MKLLTYPNRVAGGQRMCHYLNTLGVKSTNDIADSDITHVMHYNYANRVDECPAELLQKAQELGVRVINEHLLNIKKDYVDDKMKEVFGYGVNISHEDLPEFRGMIYKTSSQQAIHMHHLIQGPVKKDDIDLKPRYSNKGEPHYRQYRRWIDTRINPETIRDFRVVIMGGEPVWLIEKHLDYRCTSHPKKGYKFDVYGHPTLDEFFSADEQKKIQLWIDVMGCDWSEADVLRDNSTGLMYIIDLNQCPGGGALVAMGDNVIRHLAGVFKEKHLT